MSFLSRHRTPGRNFKSAPQGGGVESISPSASSSRVDRLLPSSLRNILGHFRGLGASSKQVDGVAKPSGTSVADDFNIKPRDAYNVLASRGSSLTLRSGGGEPATSPAKRVPSARSSIDRTGATAVGKSSSGRSLASYQGSSASGTRAYGSPNSQHVSSQHQDGLLPLRRDARDAKVISVTTNVTNNLHNSGHGHSYNANLSTSNSNYQSASTAMTSIAPPSAIAPAATAHTGRYPGKTSIAPDVSRDAGRSILSTAGAMLSSPTTPAATASSTPVCDKCDGKHLTDNCPYYKKPRDNHPDAQKGNKKLGGQSNLPGAVIRSARVVRQPGDGSCLFHSMSYGLRDGSSASSLRREICAFIASNPNIPIADSPLADWVKWDTSSSVAAYAKKMASSAWGGGIEMAVVSKMKGVNVHVYEASRDGYRRISAFDHESQPETRPVIRVLYGGGVHYDALVVQ